MGQSNKEDILNYIKERAKLAAEKPAAGDDKKEDENDDEKYDFE